MSEEQVNTAQRGPIPWHNVWIMALTKPSVATFEEIVADRLVSTRRAYTWIFFSSLVGQAIVLVGGWLTGGSVYNNVAGRRGEMVLESMVCAPVSAALAVLLFAIVVAILQWIAGLLGGTGKYEDLLPAVAAFQAPLAASSAVFAAVGFWNMAAMCLSSLLGLYGVVLHVTAIKAVNRFDWERAIATVLIPAAPVLLACVGIAVWIAVNGVPFIGI